MSTFDAFRYTVILFIALALLFNAAYFFIVLPRVRSAGKNVNSDAFINIYQPRYVRIYWEVLTEQEKHRWYNLAIKHSFLIAGLVWAFAMVLLLTAQV